MKVMEMKKIVLAALLASGLMAAGNQDYFGVNGGRADIGISSSIEGSSSNEENHITATLGHYYGNTGRVSASYTYVERSAGMDNSDVLSFAYDFILPVSQDMFSLYAGPVVGYTWLQDSMIDLSGFHYGAQAGGIVRVMDNIELEAGYRYLFETGNDKVYGINIEADKIKMWYAGFNFRF